MLNSKVSWDEFDPDPQSIVVHDVKNIRDEILRTILEFGEVALTHPGRKNDAARRLQKKMQDVAYGENAGYKNNWLSTATKDPRYVRGIRADLIDAFTGTRKDLSVSSRTDTTEPIVELVPIEAHLTEKTSVDSSGAPYEAERRESSLRYSLVKHWENQNHVVKRHSIRIQRGTELFTDIYDVTEDVLVEVKASEARESIRMAIGQIADYSRFVPESARKAILLPCRPTADLERLILAQQIEIIWPIEGGFDSTAVELL